MTYIDGPKLHITPFRKQRLFGFHWQLRRTEAIHASRQRLVVQKQRAMLQEYLRSARCCAFRSGISIVPPDTASLPRTYCATMVATSYRVRRCNRSFGRATTIGQLGVNSRKPDVERLTLGPPGPSRTIQTACPQTLHHAQRHVCRSQSPSVPVPPP
jgi:hypothetical protein